MRCQLSSWLLFLLSIVIISAYDGGKRDSTGCPIVFRQRCHCGRVNYAFYKPQEKLFVVNCTNTGFTDTDMLSQLPHETQVVLFNGNHVPKLDWNIFGIVDSNRNLEYVDLSNNKIQEILGKTFHKVSHVKVLVLNHNDLMISGPNFHARVFTNLYALEELHLTNAFTEKIDSKWYLDDLKDILITSNMTTLQRLHLEQNEIWRIADKELFCSLTHLRELHLGDNQLKDVDFELGCLKDLTYLDVEYNKIETLSEKALDRIDRVFRDDRRRINLKGNPFRCDCYMRTFFDWLKHTRASLVDKAEMRCFDGYPEYNAGRRIVNVRRLECEPSEVLATELTSHSSRTTHTLLTLLITLVVLVGIWVSFLHWDKIRSRVLQPQASVHYRSISANDDQGGLSNPNSVISVAKL